MSAPKLQGLQQLLTECALVPLDENHRVTLRESGADQPYHVVIQGVPSDSIVVKTDIFPDTRPFFRGNMGENKRSDFMVVSESKGSITCIHIELKAGRDKWGDIVKQLKGSYAVWEYMCSLNKLFKNGTEWANPCQHRYVTIRNITVNKKPTINRNCSKSHDSPDTALKVSSPRQNCICYRSLL